jgi:UDP-N-acetylmuramate dehydrogenase
LNLTAFKNFDIPVLYDAPLSGFTTFRLGGPCPVLFSCPTAQQLKQAIRSCLKERKEFILIGGGSNLVVSDEGVACYVLRYFSDVPFIQREGNEILVTGSTLLNQLARYAAENGLEGINCCTGIPGTVGGAIVGNAGAFGRQIGDVVKFISVIAKNGDERKLKWNECGFAYRTSDLKRTNDIVVSVSLSLEPGDRSALLNERDEILKIRREKHPDLKTHPCAGSFFRNIEPTSKAGMRQAAGWFLDEAGAKQLTVGGARVFEKHANIIVKADGCRSQDVYELSVRMQQLVRDKFDLELVREVRFVGQFNGMPDNVLGQIW